MVDAHHRDAWNHTASIICWTVKAAAGKRGRGLKPQHFMPRPVKQTNQRPRLTNTETHQLFQTLAARHA